jgi:hypothetical protein
MSKKTNKEVDFMIKVSISSIVLMSLTTGCIKQSNMDQKKTGSNLVSVSMKMPTKIGDQDISGKMDAYDLSIVKTGGDCTFTDIKRFEKVTSGDVKIDASLKQGCDYELMLSFGKASEDGKKLEMVYLTSDAHDNKEKKPTAIRQDDLKGKTAITVKACVSVTELGAKQLGVSTAACPSIADETTDAVIEPIIAQSALTFKITKAWAASISGTKFQLTGGEITSVASSTSYCALAAAALFNGDRAKQFMIEDAIFEVKPSDKRVIDKSFDIQDLGPSPSVLVESRVIAFCQATKPEATTTAQSLIDKCLAAKSCDWVKP